MKESKTEFEKPRIFRNRKKVSKRKRIEMGEELQHPIHQPYTREHKNWKHSVMIDGLGEEDED